MKRLSLLLFLFFSVSLLAQTPGAFNYQAIVRNSSGDVVANQNVTFRISILQDNVTGSAVYVEDHTTTTNDFGLANLEIGNGTEVSGTFSPDGWGDTPHFIKVEFDPEGGIAFQELGTSQLLSVPYAFHAETVANVNDADADPANEIQSLSLSGNDLNISDGNSVTLPFGDASPWSEDGDDIYTESSVGIGASNPEHNLDIVNPNSSVRIKSTAPGTLLNPSGDAFLVLDKASFTNNANLNLQSEGEVQFYAGLLGDQNFSISTNLSSLNGLEVQSDGDVNISGELQTKATGDANMVPIAYGTVVQGSLYANSGNVSVTSSTTGRYYISIDDSTYYYDDHAVSLTLIGHIGFIEGGSLGNSLVVAIYDQNGDPADAKFSFVVYKP